MTTNVAFDVNEFIKSLESYAAECRKLCRDTILVYDNLVSFANCCLSCKELKATHAEMDFEAVVADYTTANKDIVQFLIHLIKEQADSLFLVKDFALADRFKAVDWDNFLASTQKTFYVNIMFDDPIKSSRETVSVEDVENSWMWEDRFITINLPVELPEEYANHIHNLDLGEDGSWGNYLRLEKFGNKHDIVVSTLEEKQELIEMYRLMNKYLGH